MEYTLTSTASIDDSVSSMCGNWYAVGRTREALSDAVAAAATNDDVARASSHTRPPEWITFEDTKRNGNKSECDEWWWWWRRRRRRPRSVGTRYTNLKGIVYTYTISPLHYQHAANQPHWLTNFIRRMLSGVQRVCVHNSIARLHAESNANSPSTPHTIQICVFVESLKIEITKS